MPLPCKSVFLLAAALAVIPVEPAHSADNPHTHHVTASLYAHSLLLGFQLGIKKGAAEGKVRQPIAQCVLALNASSMVGVVESVLAKNLTPAEIQTTDAFFATPAGQKYAQRGEFDVYASVGETPPDEPVVSDAEVKEIDNFSGTATSKRLWQVLEGEPARREFGTRIEALAESCGIRIHPPQ